MLQNLARAVRGAARHAFGLLLVADKYVKPEGLHCLCSGFTVADLRGYRRVHEAVMEKEAIDLTRRRGGAEEDGEKRGNKLAEPAESAEGKDVSELCSDGKLKHAPPMRRSRLKMAKRQVRAALGWTGAKNHPRGMVGRTPWSAADAPVGPLALCMMLISLARQRDEGVPRGPGGPPHHLRSQRGHSVFHEISRAEGPFKQGRKTDPGTRFRNRGQTGLPANFRQKAPEIHGSLVSPRRAPEIPGVI